jgi:hypothetical protein
MNIKPFVYLGFGTGSINDNKIVSIQQIIDTRRNMEELLVNLIEKKI